MVPSMPRRAILAIVSTSRSWERSSRKGRCDVFTDLVYLDVSGPSSNTRNASLGGHDLPASASPNLDLNLKGTPWTVAGEYSAAEQPSIVVNVLAGACSTSTNCSATTSASTSAPCPDPADRVRRTRWRSSTSTGR